MSDEVTFEPQIIEKRLHTRHRSRTEVFVHLANNERLRCVAVNLSASGVALRPLNGVPMQLRQGSAVQLSFAINLGSVTKLHRRKATVKHIHGGITGLHMEVYKP